MKERSASPFCASANTMTCASTAYCEANFWRINDCNMTITIQEITDREQWNGFLTSQPRGHLLQSYEWGELNQYLGGRIYRLGALEHGRIIGAMMLTVSPIPIPLPVPGVRFNWLYCSRGPTVERPDSPALTSLIESVQKIARAEHAVVLRLEPN